MFKQRERDTVDPINFNTVIKIKYSCEKQYQNEQREEEKQEKQQQQLFFV